MPGTCSNDEDLGENRQYSNGTNDSVNKVSRIPPPPLPQDRHELVRMKKAEVCASFLLFSCDFLNFAVGRTTDGEAAIGRSNFRGGKTRDGALEEDS